MASNSGKLNSTQAKAWKQHAQGQRATELPLPSGLTAMVRAPGIEAFVSQGMIPNSLIPIIMDQLEAAKHRDQDKPVKREKTNEQLMDEVMKDPEKLQDIVRMAGNITCSVVSDPPIHPLPEVGEERDPELIYIDDVPMDDQMFIMNYAMGGPKSLETFREAKAASVESVSPRKSTARTTKRTGKATKKSG